MIRVPNLATRPLRNERLPAVLLGVALAGLLGLGVRHAFVLRELLPSRTAAVEGEVRAIQGELEALRAEAAALPPARPDPKALAEWRVIRSLVDRRVFSWSRLLARLEELMPPGVRLASVAPTVEDGRIGLEIAALGRTVADGFGLLKVLHQSGDFDEVVPSSVGGVPQGDEPIRYSMKYHPSRAPLTPSAASAAEGAAEPGDGAADEEGGGGPGEAADGEEAAR